ncbi:hypothetical protein [Nostoc sp. UHCC 0252]|nr:hypothetical protein [Nostoc sp. UHCC 0252]MEA5601166.1 hypothetical protein [Nostoc sp. UHCC 0252]
MIVVFTSLIFPIAKFYYHLLNLRRSHRWAEKLTSYSPVNPKTVAHYLLA